jgi:zinc transport system substrate-binding protein
MVMIANNSQRQSRSRATVARTALAAVIVNILVVFAQPAGAADEPITVYTVNYPLAYFAERIGGEHVRVTFPAPPDGDPAGWLPSGEEIAAFQQADLILLNGAGYAGWTGQATLPEDKLVDTSAGFKDRYIGEAASTHSHGEGAEHSHEAEMAFTTWLDPQLAAMQAAAIRDALSTALPASSSTFEAGYEALNADLQALDADFEQIFGKLADTPLVFSHPVYQYLERRYDVNGVSVHWEPDQVPGEDEFSKLAQQLLRHPAEYMIWEGEPEAESVAALAEWQIGSIVLDPCGNRPGEGDYMTVMRDNVTNMRAAVPD